MKKLMAILVFAGVLSVPSAVFAEASWYGALKGGLLVGGGEDARFNDGGSRWGVKGSAEAGEGLTAVYRFEHKMSTTNAGLTGGGRLAYVGLSGGFGSLTMGQIWNAAYNHAGVITDQSDYFGESETGYRHGNALSYAYSAGAVGFQLDLISDGGSDTGKAIDKTEFGMTIGLGEIGKVAIAHTNQRDIFIQGVKIPAIAAVMGVWSTTIAPGSFAYMAPPTDPTATDTTRNIKVKPITVTLAANSDHYDADDMVVQDILDNNGDVTTSANSVIVLDDLGKYNIGTCDANMSTPATTDDCVTATAYAYRETSSTTAGTATVTVNEHYYTDAQINVDVAPVVAEPAEMGRVLKRDDDGIRLGHKTTHVAVQFSVGGVSPYIGYSEKKVNGDTTKSKTTHYGMSGSLGDTGMSYLLAARSVKDAKGKKMSPWLVNVRKNLGDSATVVFGHGNDDDGKSGKSVVALHVSF